MPLKVAGKSKARIFGPPTLAVQQPVFIQDQPPPVSRANFLSVIVAAWAVAPILLWTNGFTIPETSANVQNNREWVEVVNRQWQPADPLPQQARRFVPQGAVAVQQDQPFSRPDLSLWWDPPTWSAQSAPKTPQASVAATDQPVGSRSWLGPLKAWEAADWGAQSRAKLTPQPVDNPPTGYKPWLSPLKAWETATWDAQSRAKLTPQRVDDPPTGYRPWLGPLKTWAADDWGAQSRPHFTNEFVAAVAQTPYSRVWFNAVSAWAPDTWEAQSRPPYTEGIAAQVDPPPPGYRPWFNTVVSAWTPAPVLIWSNGFLAQDGQAQVDLPRNRFWLNSVLSSWEPEPWPAQTNRPFTEGTAAQVDDPPITDRTWLPGVIAQWASPTWDAQSARNFTEAGAAPQVDPPPPRRNSLLPLIAQWEQELVPFWGSIGVQGNEVVTGNRFWLPIVLRSWEPEPWTAQTNRHFPQVAAQVDNPIPHRTWPQTIVNEWGQPSWDAQTTRHVVQAGVVAPDQPWPGRKWFPTVEAQWAVDWAAQSARHAPIPTPDNPAPKGDRLSNILSQWPQDTWAAQAAHHYTEGTPAQADPPPFGLRSWLPIVWRSWEPPDPEPRQLVRRVTEEGVAPVVEVTPDGARKPRTVKLKKPQLPQLDDDQKPIFKPEEWFGKDKPLPETQEERTLEQKRRRLKMAMLLLS